MEVTPGADLQPRDPARRPPPGLVAGMTACFVADAAWNVGWASGGIASSQDFLRWSLAYTSAHFAAHVLLLAGAFELHRRTSGRARHGAGLVLAARLVLLGCALARQYLELEAPGTSASHAWLGWITVASWHLFVIGLVVAGWERRAVRLLAAPVAIAAALAIPYGFYARHAFGWLAGAGPWGLVVEELVLDGTLLALVLAVLWHGAPRPAPDGHDRAATALDRAATALHARVWIAAAAVVLALIRFSDDGSVEVARVFLVGVPAANAIAGVALIAGVLGAAGLAVPGAPRRRLHAVGAVLAWAIAIQGVQVLVLTRLVYGDGSIADAYDVLAVFPLAVPAAFACCLVLIVDSVRTIAVELGATSLRDRAAAARVTVAVLQLVALGGTYWIEHARAVTAGSALLMTMVSLAAAIASLLVVARACREAATALRARTDLPIATVVAGG